MEGALAGNMVSTWVRTDEEPTHLPPAHLSRAHLPSNLPPCSAHAVLARYSAQVLAWQPNTRAVFAPPVTPRAVTLRAASFSGAALSDVTLQVGMAVAEGGQSGRCESK